MSDQNPAEVIGRAAKLMRERAGAATPGPWERPLDTRHRSDVIAALPEDEQGSYTSGTIPAEFASHGGITGRYAGQRERVGVVQVNTWSSGRFARERSGRDLDYVASMHPLVGAALADVLDKVARAVTIEPGLIGRVGYEEVLTLARAYLGDEAAQ